MGIGSGLRGAGAGIGGAGAGLGVSPISASPTAGVSPGTLDQILKLFMQNMNRPAQDQKQLPPMTLARRAPNPQAFQRMQQFQGTR